MKSPAGTSFGGPSPSYLPSNLGGVGGGSATGAILGTQQAANQAARHGTDDRGDGRALALGRAVEEAPAGQPAHPRAGHRPRSPPSPSTPARSGAAEVRAEDDLDPVEDGRDAIILEGVEVPALVAVVPANVEDVADVAKRGGDAVGGDAGGERKDLHQRSNGLR
mgnify:CR=1 FL=1